jgi:hypothetical protein
MTFFRKGEELEATGFKALPYDDPTLVPPKLGFRSFDSIPRNRAPLVITVLLIAVTVLGLWARHSGEWVRLKTFVQARQSTP